MYKKKKKNEAFLSSNIVKISENAKLIMLDRETSIDIT
jgi:hypothetical protein